MKLFYLNPKAAGRRKRLLLVAASLFVLKTNAQISVAPYEALFTEPKSYVVAYTEKTPLIDGNISENAWDAAPWTDLFIDIEGGKKPVPQYATRVKMLYNDTFLFVAASMEEPHVWATLKKRDAIIYHDNDFEVFINPANNGHQYYEVEVNAFNTIFDLLMPRPYRNGAGALIGYDMCELQSAVQVQGTINNPKDKDKGWNVELAIPFRSMIMGNTWKAPEEGALWRINFSRVQWDTEIVNGTYVRRRDAKGKLLPEYNWVWSPQGVINMHYPERWGYLQFTKQKGSLPRFQLPYDEKRRPYLWLVYYKQKDYHYRNGRYAATLADLGLERPAINVADVSNTLRMEATSRQFTIYITDQNSTLALNDEGLVQHLTKPL